MFAGKNHHSNQRSILIAKKLFIGFRCGLTSLRDADRSGRYTWINWKNRHGVGRLEIERTWDRGSHSYNRWRSVFRFWMIVEVICIRFRIITPLTSNECLLFTPTHRRPSSSGSASKKANVGLSANKVKLLERFMPIWRKRDRFG